MPLFLYLMLTKLKRMYYSSIKKGKIKMKEDLIKLVQDKSALIKRNAKAKAYRISILLKRLKFICLISAILFICGCGYKTYTNAPKEYSLTTVVVGMESAGQEYKIIVEDFNGNRWSFIDENGDWYIHDICSCLMSDNGTEIIYDDIIKSTKYCGWPEEWAKRYPESEAYYAYNGN